jgi:hypothetical protein
MALYIGYTPEFAVVWSLADLFEGLIPLLAFRFLKVEPNYSLKKPKITYGLTALLAVTFARAHKVHCLISGFIYVLLSKSCKGQKQPPNTQLFESL